MIHVVSINLRLWLAAPFLLLTAALCVDAWPAAAREPSSSAPVAFVQIRLFDGNAVTAETTVIVAEGKIARIEEGALIPPDAIVVNGHGRTLIPGLIDSHTHIRSPLDLRQALAFGVTTELEMAGDPGLVRTIRRMEAEGRAFDLADIRSAGNAVTAPGGHGTEYGRSVPTIASADEVETFVNARVEEGSDFIKIMYDDGTPGFLEFPVISLTTLMAAVAEAHSRGMISIVHVSSESDALAAIEAKADGLAHVPFTGIEGTSLAHAARERDVFVISTLAVFNAICDPEHGARLVADPKIRRYLPARSAAELRGGYAIPGAARPPCASGRRTLAKLVSAGVTILAGTDAFNPGTAHGASLHDELASLVEAGMRPIDALRAATLIPAVRFRLHDRGVIEVGKRADLVLVEGDPTQEIRATRAIVGVWKAGRPFDHSSYVRDLAPDNPAREEPASRGGVR